MIAHMETKRDMSYIARNAQIILNNMKLAKQGSPAIYFKPLKFPYPRRAPVPKPAPAPVPAPEPVHVPAQKKTSPKNKIQTELPI